MPHKRSKKSVRDKEQQNKTVNDAPAGYKIDKEELPKGAMRILLGGQTQNNYNKIKKEKKRNKGVVNDDMKIKPGEKLRDFNKRIDDSMRKDINSTIRKNTNEKGLKKFKQKLEEDEMIRNKKNTKIEGNDKSNESDSGSDNESEIVKKKGKKRAIDDDSDDDQYDNDQYDNDNDLDFAKAEKINLNDVVQAPPQLPKMKRQARRAGIDQTTAGQRVGSSLMRQLELDKERERVINLYRLQKNKKLENWVNERERERQM